MMDTISAFTDEQLISELKRNGLSVGPLTSTTRRIYEKRLYKKLYPDEADGGGLPTVSADKPPEKPASSVDTGEAISKDNGAASGTEVPKEEKIVTSYFGVQLPDTHDEVDGMSVSCVFENKVDALKFMKKIPGSRFKVFTQQKDAEEYSKQKVKTQCFQSPKPNPPGQLIQPGSPIPSEASAFKGPRPQELVLFRKAIEQNDMEKVKNIVWSNPRYLISSVDTPTVLQEGFHYNALHITAKHDRPEICRYLLDTVENTDFLRLIYPADSPEMRLNRMSFLVDLYLNTPDSSKGNCETPLHFASKFGNADVVEVLTSHPKTDRYRKNKYGENAAQIVCTRAKNPSVVLKDRILDLLEDRYYVPLLRAEDNTSPAVIAKPWSPSVEKDSPLTKPLPDTSIHSTPSDAPLAVRAFAGPMSPSQADKFRRRWHTPPSPSLSERRKYAEIRRSDSDKGFERIGRNVAQDMQVPWSEYWPFLEGFADLSSDKGLLKLETYLQDQTKTTTSLNKLDSDLQMIENQLKHMQLNSINNDTQVRPNPFGKMGTISTQPVTNVNNNGTNIATNCHDVQNATDNQNSVVTMPVIEESLFAKAIPKSTMALGTQGNQSMQSSAFMVPQMRRLSSEEADSSLSSVESYQTAVEDMDQDFVDAQNEIINTPPRSAPTVSTFLLGDEPTKTDLDVLRAVEGSPITPENHPHVHQWRNLVLSYSEQARNSWKSPMRTRATRSTPRRILQPGSCSTQPLSPLAASSVTSPATDSDSMSSMDDIQGNESFRHIRTNLMESFSSEGH